VFGISFPEFLVLGTVALLVLGPEKLPGMLRTLGQWLAKARKLTTEVRYQSGIDDVLRSEGLEGGLSELRGLVRGGLGSSVLSHATAHASSQPLRSATLDHFVPDKSREYPVEGCDAYGALPEDLLPPPPAPLAPPSPALGAPAAEGPSPEGPTPGAVP
jgi:sec-independent protein translocase protein TatB